MLKWLVIKIFGCWRRCEWETLNRIPVYTGDVSDVPERPIGYQYELRCKTCGEIRGKRV